MEAITICKSVSNNNIEIMKDPLTRPKTSDFINKYEVMDDDIREIIHSLSIEDFYRGPTPDRNPRFKHPVWEFIKYIDSIRVKIYLKIKIVNHKRKVIVFSIHEEGLYDEEANCILSDVR